jgi:very-short-patch-repair endonuclease
VLWQSLRGRQIENCKFRRQHPFADYILTLCASSDA